MDSEYVKYLLSFFIASNIHETWKNNRAVSTTKEKNNSYWEKTCDIKFIYNIICKKTVEKPYKNVVNVSENNVIVDTANLEFVALPYDLKYKKVNFARTCLDLIFEKAISSQKISENELNELASSLYIKYGYNVVNGDDEKYISQGISEEIKKDEYKQALVLCKETVENYKKKKINLDEIEKTFDIKPDSNTDLNLLDATKFLKIDSKPLKPLEYLKYVANNNDDLYWNTDLYSSIVSYLNANNIKNTWFVGNYSKYIDKIKGQNLDEYYTRLKVSVEKYENKPKWLVKTENIKFITNIVTTFRKKFLMKKVQKEYKRYEEEKNLVRFVGDYITYIKEIDDIKIRYSDFNRNGICSIKGNDSMYLYSDGTVIYISNDFWNKPAFVYNINLGVDVVNNIVKYLSKDTSFSISNVIMSCSMRLKEKPVMNKTISLKKLLALSSNISYVEN